jgi:hypothetical protein
MLQPIIPKIAPHPLRGRGNTVSTYFERTDVNQIKTKLIDLSGVFKEVKLVALKNVTY